MVYFMLPGIYLIVVYAAAALFPAIYLMVYIYRHDTIEKEPPLLLGNLALRGVGAALGASVLEALGERILNAFVSTGSENYAVYLSFFVVAVIEEGLKLFLMARKTWRNPNFNCRFDGIVYAAFTSLGFAAYENIVYIFRYGLSVAASRALLAVPAHLGFSVFMGLFYSRARLYANEGQPLRSRRAALLCYLVPVTLHGIYDSCCMLGTSLSAGIFVVFVAAMYFIVIRIVRRESAMDRPI